MDTLTELAKGKLNITWDDEGTEARIEAILEDAVPAVANMVGLSYDYSAMAVVDGNGKTFDFAVPSLERNVLLNYVAYEWNHQAGLFREAYWAEIAACRQKHALEDSASDDTTEDDDGSSE